MAAIDNDRCTIEELRSLFDYNPDTGELRAKTASSTRRVGHLYKGTVLRLHGKNIKRVRVVWALYYGEWPTVLVDHRDRNEYNDRIKNLRLATTNQNQHNRSTTNPNGKGVTWRDRKEKSWLAKIRVNGERINLGSFATKEEAAEAYRQAALKYHGEFAPDFLRD